MEKAKLENRVGALEREIGVLVDRIAQLNGRSATKHEQWVVGQPRSAR
jgi:hypothetical protein